MVSLQKGQKADITKGTGIKKIKICLGWDTNKYEGGEEFDLDASAFLLNKDGKAIGEEGFVFYNHLKDPSESVVHSGDNRTGAGEGDDEVISVDLEKVPVTADKIAFVVTIYDATNRKQNFGMVSNAFSRLVNADNSQELLKYDLGEDYSIETAMVMCEIYRHGTEWKFNAVGQGHAGGLEALRQMYGL